MTKLALYLFGQPRLERGGKTIEINLRKALALLTYLIEAKGEYSRDYLATLLWPESDPSNARASLRRTLYQINKSVGEELLTASGDSITLHPDVDISIDVETYRQAVDKCVKTPGVSLKKEPKQVQALEDAVALYTDDYLAGFSIPDCHQFEEWRFFIAEELRASLIEILRQLIITFEDQAEYDRAIQYGRRLLSLDALNEDAHRLLMKLYADSDQHNAALRQYTECKRILSEELGVLPQPETTSLYEVIRQHRTLDAAPRVDARPPVRYIPSGDIHIAYQVLGEGPIDLIMVFGFATHLDQAWEEPDVAAFLDHLSSFSRLIMFDKRGVGLSDRVGYPPTLEDTMDDIVAVMDGAGSDHAVLFGMTEGGPVSLLFTATYPEKVRGLILYGTCAKWSWEEDYPWVLRREQYDTWLDRLTQSWGGPLNLESYAPTRAEDPQLRDWWARTLRMSSSPGGIKAVLEVMKDIDVREILPAIQTPTLILHRKDDMAVRVGAGRHLARNIPTSRFVELEGIDHWPFMGDSQSILKEMREFVKDLGAPQPTERVLMTILAIDVLRTDSDIEGVDTFVVSEVERFRGSVISRDKKRMVIGFDGPSRAIHCTRSLIDAADEQGIQLRAAIHTGECDVISGVVSGTAIQIVESILDTSSKQNIMVTSTVKDLVAGSGFRFSACGSCKIDSIPGEWELFAMVGQR